MKKLRTIQQILYYIKQEDPDSCVTKYMIKLLDKEEPLYKYPIGNKILYDMVEVLNRLGLI